jgi:hypothetical protein
LLAPSCLSTRLQGRTRRHLSFCRRNTLTKHCSAVCSAGSNPSRCQSSCACLRAPFHGLCSRNFPALPVTQHSPLPPPLPKATHIYSTLVLSSSSPFSHCTANVSSSHLVVRRAPRLPRICDPSSCNYYVVISKNGRSAARGLFESMCPVGVFWGGYFVLNFMCDGSRSLSGCCWMASACL